MKKISILIGVLICSAFMLTPTFIQGFGTGSDQMNEGSIDEPIQSSVTGDTIIAPDASGGGGVSNPITEPSLPVGVSALQWAGTLYYDIWINVSINEFAMPDYKYDLLDCLFNVGNDLQINEYSGALATISDEIYPNLPNWWAFDDSTTAIANNAKIDILAALCIQENPVWAVKNFTTIDNSFYSGYKADYGLYEGVGHYETIRTQNAWKQFWYLHSTDPRPTVDFKTETVLLAAMGMTPTSGYSIDITDVYTIGGSTVVVVERWAPGSGNVLQVITNHIDVVSIDKIPQGQPIIFLDTFTGNVIDLVNY